MKKCSVVEIDNNCLIKHDFSRKLIRFKHKIDNYSLEVVENVYLDLRNKKTFIIVEGEEITIKLLTLPKVNKETLYDLIKNELSYSFKSLESIVFTYTIKREHKNSVELIVFCMEERKISFLQKRFSSNIKIKGFYSIQLCLLNYFQNKIKEKDYIFVFYLRKNLYCLYCQDNKLMYTNLYRINDTVINFKTILFSFIENSKILCGGEANTIFAINCGSMKSSDDIYDNYKYIDLGEFGEEQLIYKLVEKWS